MLCIFSHGKKSKVANSYLPISEKHIGKDKGGATPCTWPTQALPDPPELWQGAEGKGLAYGQGLATSAFPHALQLVLRHCQHKASTTKPRTTKCFTEYLSLQPKQRVEAPAGMRG
jgi:hypothetical protein